MRRLSVILLLALALCACATATPTPPMDNGIPQDALVRADSRTARVLCEMALEPDLDVLLIFAVINDDGENEHRAFLRYSEGGVYVFEQRLQPLAEALPDMLLLDAPSGRRFAAGVSGVDGVIGISGSIDPPVGGMAAGYVVVVPIRGGCFVAPLHVEGRDNINYLDQITVEVNGTPVSEANLHWLRIGDGDLPPTAPPCCYLP